jgi:hypothetical protein
MLSKLASALARAIPPIQAADRPKKAITTAKSADTSEGGYGPNGYEKHTKEEAPEPSEDPTRAPPLLEDGLPPAHSEKKFDSVPFRPGLTQVILDLSAQRVEKTSGSAASSYESGAKDQKKNARLPKGSMLDKKVG